MSRSRLSLWKRGAEYLKAKGVPEYSHDSRELLLSTAEISLEELYIDGEEEVSQDSIKKYSDALIRRGNREPLQYITGRTEFMGLPFILRPGVLIPRQDTEILTEAVLDAAKEHPLRSVLPRKTPGQTARTLSSCKATYTPGYTPAGFSTPSPPIRRTSPPGRYRGSCRRSGTLNPFPPWTAGPTG